MRCELTNVLAYALEEFFEVLNNDVYGSSSGYCMWQLVLGLAS